MKAHIPTLGKTGIITDPKQAVLYLFKSFLTIDKSVSNLWRPGVQSLMFLVKKHSKNPNELREAVEDALRSLYNNFFDSVKVSVEVNTATELNMTDTTKYNLEMAIMVEDNGMSYQLAAVLEDAFKEGDRMYNRVVFKEK